MSFNKLLLNGKFQSSAQALLHSSALNHLSLLDSLGQGLRLLVSEAFRKELPPPVSLLLGRIRLVPHLRLKLALLFLEWAPRHLLQRLVSSFRVRSVRHLEPLKDT